MADAAPRSRTKGHDSTRMPTPLLTAKPWRAILVFGTPILIGNIFQQMYHFVDAIIVGRILGVQSLAAVGATGSLVFLLIGFAWGASSGFAIPTAQAFGAGDAHRVRRSIAAGTVLTVCISLALSVLGPLIAGPTLALLQTPHELMADATVFCQRQRLADEVALHLVAAKITQKCKLFRG